MSLNQLSKFLTFYAHLKLKMYVQIINENLY